MKREGTLLGIAIGLVSGLLGAPLMLAITIGVASGVWFSNLSQRPNPNLNRRRVARPWRWQDWRWQDVGGRVLTARYLLSLVILLWSAFHQEWLLYALGWLALFATAYEQYYSHPSQVLRRWARTKKPYPKPWLQHYRWAKPQASAIEPPLQLEIEHLDGFVWLYNRDQALRIYGLRSSAQNGWWLPTLHGHPHAVVLPFERVSTSLRSTESAVYLQVWCVRIDQPETELFWEQALHQDVRVLN